MHSSNVYSTFQDVYSWIVEKYPDIVTEEDPLIILDSKSAVCMANNGDDTNHTSHIAIRVHFVRNW